MGGKATTRNESTKRIRDVAARLDAERFVGRRRELAFFEESVLGEGPCRVIYVHGPAGIGKSALLREFARRARSAGRSVHILDGRRLGGDIVQTLVAIATAAGQERPAVFLDEFDEWSALRLKVRESILDELPGDAIVVLAGRDRAGREWREDGFEHICSVTHLAALSTADARELLTRRGVTGAGHLDELTEWAAGYPVALTIAAETVGGVQPNAPANSVVGRPPTSAVLSESRIRDLIVDRLVGRELSSVNSRVLEIAAIAPLVDTQMLASVLPGLATRDAFRRLRELSVTESIGHRVALHRLVRDAVASRFRSGEPARYQSTVVRIADHLYSRIVAGSDEVAFDLFDLIENPELRVGLEQSSTHYLDDLREGDLDRAEAILGAGQTAWWARLVRMGRSHAENLQVVRRSTGELSAIVQVPQLRDVPEWARDEIELGPIVEHARANGVPDDAQVLSEAHFLEADLDRATRAEIVRVGNMGVMRYRGSTRFRFIYANFEDRPLEEGSEELGFVEVGELARHDGERQIRTWFVDYGPGGFAGGMHALIRGEQGAAPGTDATDHGQAVSAALRSYRSDDEKTRASLRAVIDGAFGDSPRDRLLHQIIVDTYMRVGGGHAAAMAGASMSRSSFYRHLRDARERLTRTSAAKLGPERD